MTQLKYCPLDNDDDTDSSTSTEEEEGDVSYTSVSTDEEELHVSTDDEDDDFSLISTFDDEDDSYTNVNDEDEDSTENVAVTTDDDDDTAAHSVKEIEIVNCHTNTTKDSTTINSDNDTMSEANTTADNDDDDEEELTSKEEEISTVTSTIDSAVAEGIITADTDTNDDAAVSSGSEWIGRQVETRYGTGIVSQVTKRGMYTIEIQYTSKTTTTSTTFQSTFQSRMAEQWNRVNLEMHSFYGGTPVKPLSTSSPCMIVYTMEQPTLTTPTVTTKEETKETRAKETKEETKEESTTTKTRDNQFNVAYEALEKMRRMNLEMACFEQNIPHHKIDYQACTVCLLQSNAILPTKNKLQTVCTKIQNNAQTLVKNASTRMQKHKQKQRQSLVPKKGSACPCLICASPTCLKHTSQTFHKQAGITLCLGCESLLLEHTNPTNFISCTAVERQATIDKMMDAYDRCLLVLHYLKPYMSKIAQLLANNQETKNHISLGSSAIGAVSGVLGIAAAASILTPAGPPLLIASLICGGSSTTVQISTDVLIQKASMEPNAVADRIIALYSVALSIVRITSSLRDAMVSTCIPYSKPTDSTVNGDDDETRQERQLEKTVQTVKHAKQTMVLSSIAATTGTAAAAETTATAALTTTTSSLSRVAASTLKVARCFGGAVSAAVLVMEANSIHSTIRAMKDGNPCNKAKTIETIMQTLDDTFNNNLLPSTVALDKECQVYLKALNELTLERE